MEEKQQLKEWFRTKNVKKLCKFFFDTDLTLSQESIVRTVAYDEHKRTIICCMTRFGKSWSVSQGILLWILRNKNKKLVIIAPTIQKTSIIRNYITAFVSRSPFFIELLDTDKTGTDRIRKEVSKQRMTWKNGIEMRTLSAEGQGSQLMGFGADKIIVDEECDINYEVYRSKITRMLGESGESTYVGIGNPWHRDNQMWEHWINPEWCRIHIGVEEAIVEGRISALFAEEQKIILTDREYQILYHANFPESAEDSLIDWNWINKATEKPSEEGGEIIAGFDVAEQGNDLSVITIGQKDKANNIYKAIFIDHWGKKDLMPTVGLLLPILDRFKVERITVDATGVGSGVYSRLEELRKEGKVKARVQAFKGGMGPTSPKDKERFLNLKAQAYWHLRSLFESDKISIPKNRELINQLSKMKWELTSSEKIRIRDPGTKEGDTAEEKSPDFSDSLNLMCWEGSSGLVFSNIKF